MRREGDPWIVAASARPFLGAARNITGAKNGEWLGHYKASTNTAVP
jgi:hypothetical protein